jgi:hypothetical protein
MRPPRLRFAHCPQFRCYHISMFHFFQRFTVPGLFAFILVPPIIVDGVCHPPQPRLVLGKFKNILRGKILVAVGRRIAQWLQKSRCHQHRNVVWKAIQQPARLLRADPRRQMSMDHEKTMLIISHNFVVTVSTRRSTHLSYLVTHSNGTHRRQYFGFASRHRRTRST